MQSISTVGGVRGDLVLPMDVDLFARVATFGSFFGMPARTAAWRDSRFNLCSRTSSLSKLSEMFHFHHRGVRVVVARFAPSTHRDGDHGFTALITAPPPAGTASPRTS